MTHRPFSLFLALVTGATAATAQTPAQIEADYALRRADMAQARIDTTAFAALPDEGRTALHFLYAYMPWPDMADYSAAYYAAQTNCALRARHDMPWGQKVPLREWLHFVLPVRVNNENLDTFRTACYDELRRRVAHLTMREAVLEVNHWCHEYVTYKPSDSRTSAPLASMRTATGRCGEESTFTVAALRAVGIPARQVYTPRWAHTDDNHAWVEAWVDGSWHFLGACEPEAVLDLGWFNQPASRGMLMHTKVYGRYDGPEDVMARTPCYTEINVTANYAPVERATVVVTDREGKAVKGATVEFKLYNYAELYTVMRTTTDDAGRAQITAGLGDLVAWATDGTHYGFAKCSVGKQGTVTVVLDHQAGDTYAMDLDITPPKGRSNMPLVPAEAAAENDRRKTYEDSLRRAYVSSFPDEASTRHFCRFFSLDYDRVRPLMVKACGNWRNLQRLLAETPTADRERAFALLATLSDKDLRDFDLDILRSHLAVLCRQGVDDMTDLGARIANEGLTPWRAFFDGTLTAGDKARYQADPQRLADFVARHIETDSQWNPQHYCLSPRAAYVCRRADLRSKGILFVAMARSMGIRSRIDEVTGKVQYRTAAGAPWQTVTLEAQKEGSAAQTPAIPLRLDYTPRAYMENPGYYYHFSLSRLVDGRPALQEYAETDTWRSRFAEGTPVDEGDYVLISGTRMADGSVAARMRVFHAAGTDTLGIPLEMRRNEDKLQVIGSFNSENIFYDAEAQQKRSLLSLTGRGYFVVVLAKANHEPSTHVLHDIELLKADLEAWGRPIVVLFASVDELAHFEARRHEFPNLPATMHFGIDSEGSARNELFGSTLTQGNEWPVVILTDTFNRVVFARQGYTIGIGEQIKQALGKI